MPLTFADKGVNYKITKVGGNAETKKHLEDLGFVVGGNIMVISEVNGDFIVNVKESRIAIGKSMAAKIMI